MPAEMSLGMYFVQNNYCKINKILKCQMGGVGGGSSPPCNSFYKNQGVPMHISDVLYLVFKPLYLILQWLLSCIIMNEELDIRQYRIFLDMTR